MKKSSTDQKVYIIAAVGCIASFFIGSALGWVGHEMPQQTHALRESGYQYIKPVLLCNLDSSLVQNEDLSLTRALREYIEKEPSTDIGVYYLNPSKAKWAGYNENTSFAPSSMLKVPIATAVLRSAETKEGLLSQKVYYSGEVDNNTIEDFKPLNPIKPNASYSVPELLRAMIVDSDNNATELLTEMLSEKEFENVYTDLGLEVPSASGPIDFMSPKTFTLFLRILYNGTYLSREHSEEALKLMSESSFVNGIRAGVPADVVVSSKFGERRVSATANQPSVELHDCGLVYAKNGPYFLCIMTRGSDFATLEKEIAGISKLIYAHTQ